MGGVNFQSPGAFWWMLPLGGLIVVLYLLRMRRKHFEVPATFLWPERVDEVRANSLFQRLRFNWLMVLQLLALMLLVFGLARFQWKQTGLLGKATVIVLDSSASMGATDVEPSRFEAAVDQIEKLIGSSGASDQIALVEAGTVPRVVFSLTTDPAVMRDGLKSVRQSDTPSNMSEALQLANALVGESESARILLVSDGCFDAVDDFNQDKAELVFQPIGESEKNLAVQALGVKETADGKFVYVGVKNYGLDPAKTGVTLSGDGKTFWTKSIEIGGGKTWGQTIEFKGDAKLLTCELQNDDNLTADNVAYASGDPAGAINALLVSKGNLFIENVLTLDARIVLDRAASLPATEKASSSEPSKYDLIIFDDVAAEAVKSSAVLTLGIPGPGVPVNDKGWGGRGVYQNAVNHPLMSAVDFSTVYMEKQRVIQPTGGGKVLARTDKGPLVIASEGAQKHIFLGFSVMDSDFPLTIGFPIFMANALDFLAPASTSGPLIVRSGQTVAFPAVEDQSLRLDRPEGDWMPIPARQGRYSVRGMDRVGQYRLSGIENPRDIFAQLRDDRESNIRPQDTVQISGKSVASERKSNRYGDLWRPMLLLALLVLAGEWWLFARKS